jgi:hypothetical protein
MFLPAPTKGHAGKTEDVINGGRRQSLAGQTPQRSDSFGSSASESTLLRAASYADAVIRAEQRSSDVDSTQESFVVLNETQSSTSASGTQSETDQPSQSVPVDLSTEKKDVENVADVYKNGIYMNNALRDRSMNVNPNDPANELPSLGKVNPSGKNIYTFVRCIVSEPGELTTKTITNPHVVWTFRFNVTDTYTKPGTPWYQSYAYINALVFTAQTAMENCFPFTTFKAHGLGYHVEPSGVYYNYLHQNEYVFHRINLTHIKSLDDDTRDEHMRQSIPQPVQYRTVFGAVYDTTYDVAFTISNIKPKYTRDTPPNRNEAILLEGINHLATTRAEAVIVIARLLTLYNDYRVNAYRRAHSYYMNFVNPNVLPSQPPETAEAVPYVFGYTEPTETIPIVSTEKYIPPPARQIPIPPGFTPLEQMNQMQQQQQQQYAQFALQQQLEQVTALPAAPPSAFDSLNLKAVRRSKKKSIQVDPSVPWEREALRK